MKGRKEERKEERGGKKGRKEEREERREGRKKKTFLNLCWILPPKISPRAKQASPNRSGQD